MHLRFMQVHNINAIHVIVYTFDAIKCHLTVVSQRGIHRLKTQRGKWRDRTSGRVAQVPEIQPLLAPAWP